MGRNILHVDMNAFYASVECQRRPELRQKPVAVCGDPEARHGIVLTANYVAKPRGVKTGMTIWQAKQLCPDLVVLPADMREYIRFSKMAREIYEKYTDQIEPFGLDESWLDVTGSVGLFGSAVSIAEEISERIKFELGITASIGVSDNKITAKLGSDLKSRTPSPVSSGITIKKLPIRCQHPICSMLVLPQSASCAVLGFIPSGSLPRRRRSFWNTSWGKWGWCCTLSPTGLMYRLCSAVIISVP